MRMPPLFSVRRKDSDFSSSGVVAKNLAIFSDQFVLPFPSAIFSCFFDIQFVEIGVKRLIDLHFVAG
jgi:hypothetical protein